ncbi:MAG: helix-hairpin-helix domain-containing protein [Bdellovibrionota bacterium]
MKLRSKNWILGGAVPLLSLLALSASTVRAEDFPEGPGKVIIMRSCGKCHSTDQIARQQKTEENWQATVVRMAGRGADVTTDEVNVVVKYLAANFLKVADASKVNVNKASAKDLVTLGFTDAEAAAIIDYKTRHGDFRLWADLLQIYGVDGEKCEALKDKMEF